MKSYCEWKYLTKSKNLKKDKNGGIIPQDMKTAKKADLISLPPDVEGTNCGNCRFIIKMKNIFNHIGASMILILMEHTSVKP
jgi:hypothetical protein